jgi:predicted NodU family carbamoyl transferase
MHILGINAYHGNASAAIIVDGRLIAAVEEERFNRVKYAAVSHRRPSATVWRPPALHLVKSTTSRFRAILGRASGQNFYTR